MITFYHSHCLTLFLQSISADFTLVEREELVKMFNLTDESNMSDFEDDVGIISCPLASPRSEQLGEYELPEAIEKLLATCKSNITEEQMKIVREKLAYMTDTFMDPSVPLVGTNAVAHYIDTSTTRSIRIPPRVAPGRKQLLKCYRPE